MEDELIYRGYYYPPEIGKYIRQIFIEHGLNPDNYIEKIENEDD